MIQLEKAARVAYPPELKILTERAKKRILAAIKAQDYYDGKFWRYISAEVAEWGTYVSLPERNTGQDYHNKRRPHSRPDDIPTKLSLRYPKFFIDELASWMFENPIGLQCDNENYYNELETIHRNNKLDQKLMQAGIEGCLTGGVAAKILYSPELKQTSVLLRPSRECFPIMNPENEDIMEKVHFCYFLDDDKTVWKQTFELIEGVCCVFEALYDIEKIGDRGEAIPKEIIKNWVPLYSGDNALDFIPVVLIPNEPNLGDMWGESDLESLYSPINEVCRKLSDGADALQFELFPINLLINVEESAIDKFELSAGALWHLEGGDAEHPVDARKLESALSNMEHLEAFIDRLLDMCHQWSGVPRITRDKLDTIGSISGVAIKLMFTSIVSKCNRKMMYWKPALQQVYDYALRTANIYEGFDYNPEELELEVTATPRIPQNELEQLEIQAKEIEMLVKSIVTVMKERGVQDPTTELASILAERVQIDSSLNLDITGQRIVSEAGGEEGAV
jgi:SPP1 family phage portal protein